MATKRTPHQARIQQALHYGGMRAGGICMALTMEQVEWIADQIPRDRDGKASITVAEFLAAVVSDAMDDEQDPGAAGNPRSSLSPTPALRASGAFLTGADHG